MNSRQLQKDLYLASRTTGDYRAARRGRLGQRLARRQFTKRVTGPATSALFRAIFR